MGNAWLAGGRLARGVPALAAAMLVPAMIAAASGRAHPLAADSRAGGRAAQAGVISTVAGGVGGPAPARSLGVLPCAVSLGNGSLYVADFGGSVRRVSPATDGLTTPAGTGAPGPLGDGHPATRTGVSTCGTAVDAAGNLLLTDFENSRVRVVAARTGTFYGQAMAAGDIDTIAGTATRGFSGDGGPATSAELDRPNGVALDGAGNLVIADSFSERVRVVAVKTGTFYGEAMIAGDIYTIAGGGTSSPGDGGQATHAALVNPIRPAVDPAGNLVFADLVDQRTRVVAVKTGTFYGQAMTAGDIYTVAGDGTQGFSGDGGPAASAELSSPEGVAPDKAGNLLIADAGNDRVRVVAAKAGTFYGQAMAAGHIYTIAGDGTPAFSGDGGPAASAELSFPEDVVVDGAGDLLIADAGNNRVRMVAAKTGTFYGQAMIAGDIYTVAGNGTVAYFGDSGPATHAELGMGFPSGLALDAAGSVLIADNGNNRVRVVAARAGTFYGRAMAAGHIYTIAGDGTPGFAGDGGPATGAELNGPGGLALDAAGSVLIADNGNNRVRVVAARAGTFYGRAMAAGHIYTIAGDGTPGFAGDGGPATGAELNGPGGLALDAAGNVLVADQVNNRVRVVAAKAGTFYGRAMIAGDIYTVAGGGTGGDGGPATKASLGMPAGVVLDATGNLVLVDSNHERIRVVAVKSGTFYGQKMTAGDIYTIAGSGIRGYFGDGRPAIDASFDGPSGVVVDSTGNVAIGDSANNRVRVVAAKNGTFYGVAMIAGDVYTVAGNGVQGYSGDGGQAARAELDRPGGVALDPVGSLLIADTGSGRVRVLTH